MGTLSCWSFPSMMASVLPSLQNDPLSCCCPEGLCAPNMLPTQDISKSSRRRVLKPGQGHNTHHVDPQTGRQGSAGPAVVSSGVFQEATSILSKPGTLSDGCLPQFLCPRP